MIDAKRATDIFSKLMAKHPISDEERRELEEYAERMKPREPDGEAKETPGT